MKNKKQIVLGLAVMIISLSLLIFACQKSVTPLSSSSSPRTVGLYLTDDPCQYDSVFIDIQHVEIKIDTSTQHLNDDNYGDNEDDHNEDHQHHDQYGYWDTLTIRPGVYNILQLRNGVDTLLGSINIPAAKIRKIRLTLGSNNSVSVSGTSHSLNLFPGSNNYEYIKIHSEDEDDHYKAGQTSMWLDFNVCKSIRFDNGQYYLKPYLQVFAMDNTGRIEGKALPDAAKPYITAWNATDSASALPEDNGEFKMRGLKAGMYSVIYKGSNGYKDTTITNVEVKNNVETKLPVITLHQ